MVRQRFIPRSLLVIVASLCAVLLSTGSGYALWMAKNSTGLLAATPTVTGFAVQRDGGVADYATANSNAVNLFLTNVDASALLASHGATIYVPFTITMMTSGTNGMNYSIKVGQADAGSFLADAQLQVFPVAQGGCTSPGSSGNLTDITGVATAGLPRPTGTVAHQYWCLTVTGTIGSYETTATAKGTSQMGADVVGHTTWQVYTGPSPGLQKPVSITLTYETTRLGDS